MSTGLPIDFSQNLGACDRASDAFLLPKAHFLTVLPCGVYYCLCTQIAQQAQWFPHDILARDTKTRKLMNALLQGQLLNLDIVTNDQLDPRMVSVLKKCPMVSQLPQYHIRRPNAMKTLQSSDIIVTSGFCSFI